MTSQCNRSFPFAPTPESLSININKNNPSDWYDSPLEALKAGEMRRLSTLELGEIYVRESEHVCALKSCASTLRRSDLPVIWLTRGSWLSILRESQGFSLRRWKPLEANSPRDDDQPPAWIGLRYPGRVQSRGGPTNWDTTPRKLRMISSRSSNGFVWGGRGTLKPYWDGHVGQSRFEHRRFDDQDISDEQILE